MNVDLVPANAIQITPDNTANTITIGENHSGAIGNPHNTQHDQTGPACVDPTIDDTTCNKHISNAMAQGWDRSITGIQVDGGAVLENPGATVNIAAGVNVTLAADVATHTVTITAGGGAPISTGVLIFHPNAEQQEMISDPIDSGLGAGPICVTLGLQQGQNEPIFVGPFEVFESFNFPQVLLGAQVNPSNGRFRAAVRFSGTSDIGTLQVRWWAYRPTVDMGTWTEKEKEKDKDKEKDFEKIEEKVADKGLDKVSDKTFEKIKETDKAAEKTFETKVTDKVAEVKAEDKVAEKVTDKTLDKAVEKSVEKALEKAIEGIDVAPVVQPGTVVSPGVLGEVVPRGKTFISAGERPDVGAVKEQKKEKQEGSKGGKKKGR